MEGDHLHVLERGVKGYVTVNQKGLIDKILARYSSDFVVCREFLQNADDAGATEVALSFQTTGGSGGKEAGGVAHVVVRNNGRAFTDQDWHRVASIAEGNPDADVVGMFGVGFYSVFSLSDTPVVSSGSRSLGFEWEGVQLTTRSLDRKAHSDWTSVAMPIKASEVRPWDFGKLKAFLCKALCFTKTVTSLRVNLDGEQLCCVSKTTAAPTQHPCALAVGDKKVHFQCDTYQTTEFVLSCESAPHRAVKSRKGRGGRLPAGSGGHGGCGEGADGDVSVTRLFQVTAVPKARLPEPFQKRVRRIMKKELPTSTSVRLLFAQGPSGSTVFVPPLDADGAPQGKVFVGLATHQTTGTGFHLHAQLIPTVERENIDFQDPDLGSWNANLLVFAGALSRLFVDVRYAELAATLASTPGAKRGPRKQQKRRKADMDGSDSHGRAGDAAAPVAEQLRALLGTTAFLASTPSGAVSTHLARGYFEAADNAALVVPVGRSATGGGGAAAAAVALAPAATAFVPSRGLEKLLVGVVPVVPAAFLERGQPYFRLLQDKGLLQPLDVPRAIKLLGTHVLPPAALPHLVRWIKANPKDAKRLAKACRWHTPDGQLASFSSLKHYAPDGMAFLPLPANTLPAGLAKLLSDTDKEQTLGLKPLSAAQWLKFLKVDGALAALDRDSGGRLLAFLSRHAGELTASALREAARLLQKTPCVPVRGAKALSLPPAAFLPHPGAAPGDAIVDLDVVEDSVAVLDLTSDDEDDDDCDMGSAAPDAMDGVEQGRPRVAASFLKRLGVRSAPKVSAILGSLGPATTNKAVVRRLLQVRLELSASDLDELRRTPFLAGFASSRTSAAPASEAKLTKFAPTDLVFPGTTAARGGAQSTTVLFYPGLADPSPERDLLALLGVGEAPPLATLLAACQDTAAAEADRRQALMTLVRNFRRSYSGAYKPKAIARPFLPCLAAADDHASGQGEALALPVDCFSEATGGAFQQLAPWFLDVLQAQGLDPRDLSVYPAPTVTYATQVLGSAALGPARRVRIMEHLSAASFTQLQRTTLRQLAFVPLPAADARSALLARPADVCLASDAGGPAPDDAAASKTKRPIKAKAGKRRARAATAASSPTATDAAMAQDATLSKAIGMLVQLVSFSAAANEFLRRLGVGHTPDPEQLVDLLAARAASVLRRGARYYVALLALLCDLGSAKGTALSKQAKAVLKGGKLLLGCRRVEDGRSGAPPAVVDGYSKPRLCCAADLVLVDDQRLEHLLRPLVPPPLPGLEDRLETLYHTLSVPWLSAAVTTQDVARGAERALPCCLTLQATIRERLPLLVRTNRGVRRKGIRPAAEAQLAQLKVVAVTDIAQEVTFQGTVRQCTGDLVPTCALHVARKRPTLSVVPDAAGAIDLYYVCECLARFLYTDKLEAAHVYALKESLGTPLAVLARRGVPVSRLLPRATPGGSSGLNMGYGAAAAAAEEGEEAEEVAMSGGHGLDDSVIVLDDSLDESDFDVAMAGAPPRELVPDFGAATRSSGRGLKAILKSSACRRRNVTTDADEPALEQFLDRGCNPAAGLSLTRDARAFHGIPMFWDGGMVDASRPPDAVIDRFAALLADLSQLFGPKIRKGVHMFMDLDGPCIAYNQNRALFFNLRYFLQVHTNTDSAAAAEPATGAAAAAESTCGPAFSVRTELDREAKLFWFMTFCHELAHNAERNHCREHESLLESLAVAHMPGLLEQLGAA